MNRNHDTSARLRLVFFIIASLLILASMLFSNRLARDLAGEEKKKIELLAEAIRLLASEADSGVEVDYTLAFKIIEGNTSIPVILVDEDGSLLDYNNLILSSRHTDADIHRKAQNIMKKKKRIEIKIDKDYSQYVYYDDSSLLKKLTYFPFVQLLVMLVFLIVTVYALNTSRRAEQDRVWVGLSKETAHQLGTPISSLLAWVELLKLKNMDEKMVNEISKDAQRLKTIAERFSKIGSKANLVPTDLENALNNAVTYIRNRSSKKIQIITQMPEEKMLVFLNEPLFEWVIENLCKNAIDAMDVTGQIHISVIPDAKKCYIDVSDTGKGIPKSLYKAIFRPGFTTKERGWGLGLSLVKRIIEENHQGRIFVKSSELGKGTTFRIVLNKAS